MRDGRLCTVEHASWTNHRAPRTLEATAAVHANASSEQAETNDCSMVMNEGAPRHPLFFLFTNRAGSRCQRLLLERDDNVWLDDAPSTPASPAPVSTLAPHRCCCPRCQSCLPSCFSALPDPDEAYLQRGRRVQLLRLDMRADRAHWRPAVGPPPALQTCPCPCAADGAVERASGFSSGGTAGYVGAGELGAASSLDSASARSDGPASQAELDSTVRPPAYQPAPRFGHTAVVYGTDTMVVFGGKGDAHYLSDVNYYCIRDGYWSEHHCESESGGLPWPTPRSGHTAVLYRDDMFVLSGGINDGNGCADDLWRFHVPTATWTRECLRLPFSPRKGHSTHLLLAASTAGRAEQDLLVTFGGLVRFSRQKPRPGDPGPARVARIAEHAAEQATDVICMPTNDVWLYQLNTGRWALLKTSGDLPAPRFYHVAQLIEDTTILLVFGGRTTQSDAQAFDAAQQERTVDAAQGTEMGSEGGGSSQPRTPASTRAGGPTLDRSTVMTAGRSSLSSAGSGCHCLNDLHYLEVSTGVWRRITGVHGESPSPRTCCASVYANGVFAVFAGGSTDLCQENYEFHLSHRQWRRLEVRDAPACSRPTVVFTGDRLLFYGGCVDAGNVLGHGRRGVLELALPPLSMRNTCDLWVRKATFNETFAAATRRCRAALGANPHDADSRFPSHNFGKCWPCSPSPGSPLHPQQQQQQPSSPSASAYYARRGPPRTPPLRIAFPHPPVPPTADRGGPLPMSPTDPLPVSAATSTPRAVLHGIPSTGGDGGAPHHILRMVPRSTLSPGTTDERGGPPIFPRHPSVPHARAGTSQPTSPGPIAGSGPPRMWWVPPRSSPRASTVASPHSIAASVSTGSNFPSLSSSPTAATSARWYVAATAAAAQASPSNQNSPSLRPAAAPGGGTGRQLLPASVPSSRAASRLPSPLYIDARVGCFGPALQPPPPPQQQQQPQQQLRPAFRAMACGPDGVAGGAFASAGEAVARSGVTARRLEALKGDKGPYFMQEILERLSKLGLCADVTSCPSSP